MAQRAPALEIAPFTAGRDHSFDPWHMFVESVPMMVEEAREVRLNEKETKSYRIRVGCTVLATDAVGTSMGIFNGGNTKVTPSAGKVCAETRTIRRAQKAGMTNIIGMVVVGDPQPDDGSGLASPTLHCCEECRLGNLGTFSNDDTLVLTAHPQRDKFQLQTARELIALHDAVVAGAEPMEPPLFHDPHFVRWETSRLRYGDILLQEGIRRVEATIQPPEREVVIAAARTAITGFALAV